MSATLPADAGKSAILEKGWWLAHQWLVLRRFSQLSILILFMTGPWLGYWIVKGNLTSSLTLNFLPLTDPYVLLQSLMAGYKTESAALIGAAIVTIFYLLVGGRVFCSWVCPVNIVTDSADWLRRRLNLKGGARFSRNVRYWMLLMTLVLAAITTSIAWELVNPVSLLHRGIIYGSAFAIFVVVSVFLFDFLISREGWCGHLCPVGAFYSLLGRYIVCPEEQVINSALKGADKGCGPVILDMNCTNCGRCIDVCSKNVFKFSNRFNNSTLQNVTNKKEVAS